MEKTSFQNFGKSKLHRILTSNLPIFLFSQITKRLIIIWIYRLVDLYHSTCKVHMYQLLGS